MAVVLPRLLVVSPLLLDVVADAVMPLRLRLRLRLPVRLRAMAVAVALRE